MNGVKHPRRAVDRVEVIAREETAAVERRLQTGGLRRGVGRERLADRDAPERHRAMQGVRRTNNLPELRESRSLFDQAIAVENSLEGLAPIVAGQLRAEEMKGRPIGDLIRLRAAGHEGKG